MDDKLEKEAQRIINLIKLCVDLNKECVEEWVDIGEKFCQIYNNTKSENRTHLFQVCCYANVKDDDGNETDYSKATDSFIYNKFDGTIRLTKESEELPYGE